MIEILHYLKDPKLWELYMVYSFTIMALWHYAGSIASTMGSPVTPYSDKGTPFSEKKSAQIIKQTPKLKKRAKGYTTGEPSLV